MLNVNVGVLGHVDCGKTSLGTSHGHTSTTCITCLCPMSLASQLLHSALRVVCCGGEGGICSRVGLHWCLWAYLCVSCWVAAVAALSTTLSTAALDKHPQSKERGITLDLGFSAFTVSTSCLCRFRHP